MQTNLKDIENASAITEALLSKQHTPDTFSNFHIIKADGTRTRRPCEGTLVGDFVLVDAQTGEAVGAEVLYQTLDRDRTIETVNAGKIRGSSGLILCPGITQCQAIVFWDSIRQFAVVAHKNQATDPRDILAGQAVYHGMPRNSESIEILLPNPAKESVHMAHVCINAWHPHSWIEDAVKQRGFDNPIALLKAETGRLHVAIDAQSGLLVLMSPSWKLPIVMQLPIHAR